MRRFVATLALAGSLLAVAGCGGDDGAAKAVSPELYTSSVCATLSTWRRQLEAASASLISRTNTMKSLKLVRREFVAFFGGAVGETDKLLAAVERAGVPDVNNGPQVTTALLRSLRKFRPILIEAEQKARRLPVRDEEQFTIQAQGLGAEFIYEQRKLSKLWATLSRRFDAPELASAAKAAAPCATL